MVEIVTSFTVSKEQADRFEILLDAVIRQNETVLSTYNYQWEGVWQETEEDKDA